MNTEFEATFTDINKDNLRKRLKDIGADLVTKERLMRRWTLDFEHPKEDYHRWARVRDEGDQVTTTFKQHAIDKSKVGIERQKEIEVVVDDFEAATKLLEAVGCERDMYQESKREEWQKDGVEIVIDTWPHLEPFVEIEDSSESAVKKIAQELNFDWDNALFSATGALYKQKYGALPSEAEGVEKLTFGSDNPFV